jgi:hypothetical protein
MGIIHIVAGMVLLSLNSFAGTVIASGDSNIATSMTGGNATFFTNVLGSGTGVLIQELESVTAASGVNIANYYNGLPGVTATQTTATSVTSLAGVNLFITILPQAAYSADEISAMSSFLSGGGTLFFIGESSGYSGGGVADPIITSTLSALGSTMTMSGNDGSFYSRNAVVVSNPLTAGVGTFTYGFTSFVSGGTALFDTNPGAAQGSPFVEVQTVGGTSTTPEPVSEVLTLGGLAGLGLLARRKKKI